MLHTSIVEQQYRCPEATLQTAWKTKRYCQKPHSTQNEQKRYQGQVGSGKCYCKLLNISVCILNDHVEAARFHLPAA